MTSSPSQLDTPQRRKPRDWPHIIKWILLIILLFLLFLQIYPVGQDHIFAQRDPLAWLKLITTLLLIIGLIILIRIQRSLFCQILKPHGCTEETPDPIQGILFVNVTGTAAGMAFGYYTIEIQKDGDPPQPDDLIHYPGGGTNGTAPVLNGQLAMIDTTGLSDGAYTITLKVFPIGAGKEKVCSKTFNLLKIAVWIRRVRTVAPSPNIFDENAQLLVSGNESSFGGSMALLGSAYIYACEDRAVQQVEMRYAHLIAGGVEPMQPATSTAIPSAWPASQQLLPPLIYDSSKYWPWTRIGMADSFLLNTWGTCTIGTTNYPALEGQYWQSRTITGDQADGGKYVKLLLATTDSNGKTYYDSQKVWIDNHWVRACIYGFQWLNPTTAAWEMVKPCEDLMISWGKIRIIGIAWDALIDPDYPDTLVPNDNFNRYELSYRKQFFLGIPPTIAVNPIADRPFLSNNARVPHPSLFPLNTAAIPEEKDGDILAEWDLGSLDAGADPNAGSVDPKRPACSTPPSDPNALYRGCACTYILSLSVHDNTSSDEVVVHHPTHDQSLKIVNDVK